MPSPSERLATIETKLDYITVQIDKLTNNHLPHIYSRLEVLEACNAVNKSWVRFTKPIAISIISAGAGGLLTYMIVKACGG